MRLILASKSPRRLELIRQMGLVPTVCPADTEEKIEEGMEPFRIALTLAKEKAEAISNNFKGDVILSADTIVVLNDEVFGKPKDKADACHMLSRLSGNYHEVYTGICIALDGEEILDFEKTVVKFKELSSDEIEGYISTGDPMDKAGGYGIQGKGAMFIERIDGDYYNVMGLPVCKTYGHLKKYFTFF